ncbi:MAG: hypothetical protein J5482_02775 [Oscillospiraceae bacterium]|nr:hypothetical protein [Oscillospiraceae bacterium]
MKAGGDFGYIAQNVATIYYCICNFADENGELTEDQRIYASLLIDAAAHLKNGSIDPEELQTSVQMANAYEIGGNFFCLHHVYNLFGTDAPDKYAELICATADLEVLTLSASSKIGYRAVIDQVMKNIPKIEAMVIKTIEQGVLSPLFENLRPSVLWYFHQPSFLEDVKSLRSVAPNYPPEGSSSDDVPF